MAGIKICLEIFGMDRLPTKPELENLSDRQIKRMLLKANAAASIVTTRKGAIYSMPELIEIDNVMCGNMR